MRFRISATIALFSAILPLAARADVPGDHPGYLHALTDLRIARWNLQHRPGEVAVSIQEDRAISEIDRAIGEIKKAIHDDGKDGSDHPPGDADLDHPGRLHHALDLLDKAHNDLSLEEDNPAARALKHRALDHVDRSIEATRQAIHDVERAH